MHPHNHDFWQTIGGIITDPVHAPILLLAVSTTIGTCVHTQIVRNRCCEILCLAKDWRRIKYVTKFYAGVRYINPGGHAECSLIRASDSEVREFDDHINIQMLEARYCALYTPLLSLCPLVLALEYFYVVFIAPPLESDLTPDLIVLLNLALCYLIQRAVFDHGLDRYFEAIENCEQNFNFDPRLRSKQDELEATIGLNHAYLRFLFLIAPLTRPSNASPGLLGPETRLLLERRGTGAGRRRWGMRRPFLILPPYQAALIRPPLSTSGRHANGQALYTIAEDV